MKRTAVCSLLPSLFLLASLFGAGCSSTPPDDPEPTPPAIETQGSVAPQSGIDVCNNCAKRGMGCCLITDLGLKHIGCCPLDQ
jgi:hypothetical protein